MAWCASRNDGLRVTAARCALRNDGLRGTMAWCAPRNDVPRVTIDSAERLHGVLRVTMSRYALRDDGLGVTAARCASRNDGFAQQWTPKGPIALIRSRRLETSIEFTAPAIGIGSRGRWRVPALSLSHTISRGYPSSIEARPGRHRM